MQRDGTRIGHKTASVRGCAQRAPIAPLRTQSSADVVQSSPA
jgi:hypothetical protein